MIRYIRDAKKNTANLRKHGISFERAVRIFEGFTLEYQDERFEYGEIREIAIGTIEGSEFAVVFTDVAESERRIISARAANRYERQIFWQACRRHD